MSDWTAIFTDADGAVVAICPGAKVGPVDLPLSDTESWQVIVPAGSEAAAALLLADPLPLVECMVKRDGRVVTWGPCVDLTARPGGPVEVECRGATLHLDRTLVGPAEMPNEHTDPDFSSGLTDWDEWRTDLEVVGEWAYPTFVDVDGVITVETTGTGIPDPPIPGTKMVRFRGDLLGDTEGCQIAEDFEILPSAHRDLMVTARAAFYVPTGTPFVRTNIDGAVYVSAHPTDATLPAAYFAPTDIAVAPWPEVPIQGNWFDAEATLTLPAGTGPWLVHVAYSPPAMDCFVCLPECIVDYALEAVDSTGPETLEDLVMHAQSGVYGHADRNLAVSFTPGGARVDRFYPWAGHQSIGAAIRELADQGLVEWRTEFTATVRTIVAATSVGSVVDEARIVATTLAAPSGVRVLRFGPAWSRGSDVVLAQLGAGGAERSAETDAGLGWEEILPAHDHVPRWRLPDWATAKVAETATPTSMDVEWPAGSVWATGDAAPGDLVDAVVDIADAVRVSGQWRAVQVTLDPATDRAVVSLSPVDVEVVSL